MAVINILDIANACNLNIDPRTLGRIEVQANCPFCKDRKKHLYLNTNENKWMCQRCRQGGGAIALYALIENINESEAFHKITEDPRISVSSGFTVVKSVKQYDLRPLEERHTVYLDFLTLLNLSSHHRANLKRRGLTDEIIAGNLYKSVPLNNIQRERIIQNLLKSHDLRGVPGFYYDEKQSQWRMAARGGFFIPVCNHQNQIQGLQIRLDDESDKKYRWFSTSKYNNGCGAKGWAHIAGDISCDTLCITEGALKADIASFLGGGILYVAVPGSNSVSYLADALCMFKQKHILECLDMDKLTNEHVRAGVEKIERTARPHSKTYSSYRWDSRYKGIDDFLLFKQQNQIYKKAA